MAFDVDDPQIRLLQGLLYLFDKPTELALVPVLIPGIEFQQQTIKYPAKTLGFNCHADNGL